MHSWLSANWLSCTIAGLGLAVYTACPLSLLCQNSATPQKVTQEANAHARPIGGSASITGVVLDVSGAVVAEAKLSLTDSGGVQQRSLVAGPAGEFAFNQIPAGTYVILINAPGLEPFRSEAIVVAAQQSYSMPDIVLSIATRRTEMNISPTEVVADRQVKAQEQQRILGVLPNFYTSYLFDAVPLNTRQKYSLAFHATFDPIRFIGSGVGAAMTTEDMHKAQRATASGSRLPMATVSRATS